MPRRTKKKKANEGGTTYYKAKNGRFYKKIQVDGKTRVRFVSNQEATGAMKITKSSVKKTSSRKPRKSRKREEPAPLPEEEKQPIEEKDAE